MQNLAEVWLWGALVGALTYDDSNKMCMFEYAPSWLKKGVEIAPLQMPLSNQKYQFTALNYETYKGLPAIFADVLPDDFGNAVIDAWLARQGRDSYSFSSLERLLYNGTRGMGALEFEPTDKRAVSKKEDIELASLVAMAQQVLDKRNDLSTNVDNLSDILQVGTSAGGARAKAIIAINKERTQIRSGQVGADNGFEHYLLKFDGVVEHKVNGEVFGDPKGFGRMEYAYYLMAKDAGINIMHSELLLEGERAHFITKRFDRVANEKIHFSSLCAMDHADFKQPGSYSYEQLLSVARQLKLPRKDAVEIFRRMVFNVIARNHDDHTKNTGFLLRQNSQQWRLSPAYDLAYSYKKDSPWVNTHQMTINGKRDAFVRADLLAVGGLLSNFNKEAQAIVDKVLSVVSLWNVYAQKAGVFEGLKVEVQQNLRLSI